MDEVPPLRPDAVVFDVVGTLFDLGPVEQALTLQGAPPAMLEAWFERLLHTATALTLAGEYAPFAEIASSTLGATAARLGVVVDPAPVLSAFRDLPLGGPAGRALERLADESVTLAALTNSGAEQARALLSRAGVLERFAHVVSVEDVRRYKPDAAPYRFVLEHLGVAPERVGFVAAHAWDVLGAERVGMRAVWIAAHEQTWPLPIRAGETATDAAAAAALLLA